MGQKLFALRRHNTAQGTSKQLFQWRVFDAVGGSVNGSRNSYDSVCRHADPVTATDGT